MYLGQCGGLVGSVKRFPRGWQNGVARQGGKTNFDYSTGATSDALFSFVVGMVVSVQILPVVSSVYLVFSKAKN